METPRTLETPSVKYALDRPRCSIALKNAINDGLQLSIHDVGFTDIPFQEPCSRGNDPHSRWNEQIDLSGYVTSRTPLRLPILSSCMPGVTNPNVATILGSVGGLAVLPREAQLSQLEEMIHEIRDAECPVSKDSTVERNGRIRFAASVGVAPKKPPSAIDRVERLAKLDVEILFIELQQANSARGMSFCNEVRRILPQLELVIGNFNSVDGVRRAIDSGADGVKVALGKGDACTTDIMSGNTKGLVNTVFELARFFHTHTAVPVIVDGGTHTPGGAAIMLCALQGNGAIMLGSKIAATRESAAPKSTRPHEGGETLMAEIEGMSSLPVAKRRGESVNRHIPEGKVIRKEVSGSLADLLRLYEGGFRTAMYGYHGARNWRELAERAIVGRNSASVAVAQLLKCQ